MGKLSFGNREKLCNFTFINSFLRREIRKNNSIGLRESQMIFGTLAYIKVTSGSFDFESNLCCTSYLKVFLVQALVSCVLGTKEDTIMCCNICNSSSSCGSTSWKRRNVWKRTITSHQHLSAKHHRSVRQRSMTTLRYMIGQRFTLAVYVDIKIVSQHCCH